MTCRRTSCFSLGTGALLFGILADWLSASLATVAALHAGLCAGGLMEPTDILAMHAAVYPAFWPQIMLAGGLGVLAAQFALRRGIAVERALASALLSPLMVAGCCWIAQMLDGSLAAHMLLMFTGIVAAMGTALAIPVRGRVRAIAAMMVRI